MQYVWFGLDIMYSKVLKSLNISRFLNKETFILYLTAFFNPLIWHRELKHAKLIAGINDYPNINWLTRKNYLNSNATNNGNNKMSLH